MCSIFPLKITADDGDEALQEDVFACEETSDVFRTTFEEKEFQKVRVIQKVQEGWLEQGELPGEYSSL